MILQANNNDSLRIVCAYHRTPVPGRGSTIVFQPLEHLQAMHFTRRKDLPLSMMGSRILDLHACRTSLEVAEVILNLFMRSIQAPDVPSVSIRGVRCYSTSLGC